MRAFRSTTALLTVLLLLAALVGCTGRYPGSAPLVIATGGPTGVYYNYGRQFADVLSRDLGVAASVSESNGSVDNLLRIGRGQAMIGFAQSDAAADAVKGSGAFDEPLPIRAIARLYDEYVHVVVRSASSARNIADLRGRTISLGAKNSGVAVVAERILDAAGVPAGSVINPQLNLGASIEALERGEIEGFFWVGGLPTPGIEKLADVLSIRLLPVDASIVNRADLVHPGVYRPAELPAGAYGRAKATATMTVPNYLVTRADAPEDLVHDTAATLFARRSEIAAQVAAAALLDRRQAIFTSPIELHQGAIAYYREMHS